MNEYLRILVQLILSISVLSSVLGMYLYPKMNVANKYFVVYIITSTIIEFLSMSFANIGINNLVFFHISVILDFIILTHFFSHALGMAGEKITRYALVCGILIFLFNSLWVQTIYTYNSINLTISGIYLISCCLLYFYHTIDHQEENKQHSFTQYAVYSIFILQFISIMVLFFGNTLLSMEKDKQFIIWNVRASLIFLVKVVILFQLVQNLRYIVSSKVKI